jgi:hypothetical protein
MSVLNQLLLVPHVLALARLDEALELGELLLAYQLVHKVVIFNVFRNL